MTFPILGGNGAVGAFSIDNSLRFNDDDSAYLSRTPSSSGNQQIWTLSTWIKKSKTGNVFQNLFSQTGGASASQRAYVLFSDDLLVVAQFNGSSLDFNYTSNAKFRDVSAWYHLVVSVDTTQATASDRVKIYMNGEQITSFSSTTNPSQNLNTYINTTQEIGIGHDTKVASRFFDGYVAETHLIDGTAKAPTDFGEFDEDSGIWKPIRYSGSYGTNGFKLNFSNSGSLGADQSGNGNNFTPTNLASTDQTTDTPTNNFATLNPLYQQGSNTFSEGNCKVVLGAGDGTKGAAGNFAPPSGKWYWEVKHVSSTQSSILIREVSDREDYISYYEGNFAGYEKLDGNQRVTGNTESTYGASYTSNDIIMVALDMDNDRVYFGKNGLWNDGDGNADESNLSDFVPLNGVTNGVPAVANGNASATATFEFNFGNAPYAISSGNSDDNGYGNFEYAPPSGYLALCTQNLATALSPTISDASQYFNTVLFTGNGANDHAITGVGFQPDWVWLKGRNSADGNNLWDINRGVNNRLFTHNTNAELADTNSLKSFDSDGFTMDNDPGINGSGDTYVTWNWLGSNTTASNTDGTITSTVSANTTAGFSIVTFTGTSSNVTTGHGLNQAPEIFFIKSRVSGGTNWNTYTSVIDGSLDFLFLNSTQAAGNASNSLPTSSVIYQNQTDSSVAYCFHSVEGYSKIGKYTGNGTDFDGAFVYTGFKPSFLMVKNATNTGEWGMFDSVRNTFNVVNARVSANSDGAEYSGDSNRDFDFISNGFKVRNGSADVFNTVGDKFIYMCFAENPFVISTGVPVVAR